MDNYELAKKITDKIFETGFNTYSTFYDMALNAAIQVANIKDEQYKQKLGNKSANSYKSN